MARKKQESSFPKSDKEVGRRETFMMLNPYIPISEHWAYHNETLNDVKNQLESWDLVHPNNEEKGAPKAVRVTIIYEEV